LRDIEWGSLFGNGLIWALTFRRFDFARSFNLPVFLLEGLKGKRRRQRMKVLQKNTRGHAVLLTVAFVHIEQALQFSLIVLAMLLFPGYSGLPIWEWMTGQEPPLAFTICTNVLYVLTMTVLEPIYVASGFTLYLNRRVELEAWDIEVDLRRHLPEGDTGAADEPGAAPAGAPA